jgi:hypothetical protein
MKWLARRELQLDGSDVENPQSTSKCTREDTHLKTFTRIGSVCMAFLIHGCGPCTQDPVKHDPKMDLRREVELALTSRIVSSSMHELHRTVHEFALNRNFTTIHRGADESERGVYDTVWTVQGVPKPFTVLEYHRDGLAGMLHFLAIWPYRPADSSSSRPCRYVLVTKTGLSATHPRTTVWSNMDSTTCSKMFPAIVIDKMHVVERDLRVSYELLGSRPIDFFLDVELDGVPLRTRSPDNGVVY